MNMITMDAPATQRAMAATDIITWTIRSVGNPEYGQARTANASWDFDVTDADVFTIFTDWTRKFEVFLYDKSTTVLGYTARSYGVLNSAYLGFDYNTDRLDVNSYNPQNMSSRIQVWAGSQTGDIPISTHGINNPMGLLKLILSPSTNARTPDSGNLSYTSKWQDYQFN
jgi:hypothetical protein